MVYKCCLYCLNLFLFKNNQIIGLNKCKFELYKRKNGKNFLTYMLEIPVIYFLTKNFPLYSNTFCFYCVLIYLNAFTGSYSI